MRGKAAQSLSMEDVTRSNVSGLGLRRRSSFPSLGLPRASGPLPAKLCASLPFSRVPTLVGTGSEGRQNYVNWLLVISCSCHRASAAASLNV